MSLKALFFKAKQFVLVVPKRCFFGILGIAIPWDSLLTTNGFPYLWIKGTVHWGKSVRLNSGFRYNPIGLKSFSSFVVQPGATLVVGDDAGLSNVTVYCSLRVVIGRGTQIGGDVRIYDTDFHPLDPAFRRENRGVHTKCGPVVIGDNVFIGTGAIVLHSTTIGENSVIGAGAVVKGAIGANEVWAGNPARKVGTL